MIPGADREHHIEPARATTPDLEKHLSRRVIGVCVVLWVLSFAMPLQTPPLTLFAASWLAVMVWGFILTAGGSVPNGPGSRSALVAVLAAVLVLVVLAARWRPEHALVLATGGAVFAFGVLQDDPRWRSALLWSILIAGLLNAGVSAIQVFAPGASVPGVAPMPLPGRAGGNLGQPNQVASLELLALAAVMALRDRLPSRTAPLCAAVLAMCIAFSQSRTGMLGLAILLVWAGLDKRLPKPTRWIPVWAVVGCLAGFALLALNAQFGHGDIFLQRPSGSDISTSRFRIWSDSLDLIRAHPWAGVGWGNLSAAWSFTPNPGRASFTLDNAHNLPLQLMVEIGIPLATGVLGALAWALWRSRAALTRGPQEQVVLARCIAMMLALLGVHSLLEYPLWYTYFLVPACYFLGVLVRFGAVDRLPGVTAPMSAAAPDRRAGLAVAALKGCGVLIVLGSMYAAWDYSRVVQAFTPFGPGLRKPLEQRVSEGRKSVLFGHLVDYGAITNATAFAEKKELFERPSHRLVNPHFLRVYAQALHEWGDDAKASYVAQRLSEFHDPRYADFFAACADGAQDRPLAFQCRTPSTGYGFDDLQLPEPRP